MVGGCAMISVKTKFHLKNTFYTVKYSAHAKLFYIVGPFQVDEIRITVKNLSLTPEISYLAFGGGDFCPEEQCFCTAVDAARWVDEKVDNPE